MALGAARVDVVRLVLFDGVKPVAIGLAVGLGAGAIFRLAAQPLFERLVPGMDATILVAVPTMLLAAGAIACYLPARRASLVDPNVALRES
jgi:ABC-type lipoprotein release transport system permease subunit